MAKVKGTAVQSSLRYVRERFGEEALEGLLTALPAADRAPLGSVLASSWYPMDAFLRFMQEARRQLSAREPDVVRNMGRASADYGVTGVYKVFFKVGSPQFIISRATRVFSSYYDTGRIAVVESRDGRAVVEVSGLEGSAPEFCQRILGWMERTIELAGAKGLRSAHSLCVHRGDAVCRFEGDWE
jgi:uncharacterized protein (TIGR02265 family)